MSDTTKILEQYKNNEITLEEALLELKKKPFDDIGYAKVDLHRKIRQGAAEVIYGEGKTPKQIVGICNSMIANGQTTILITRLSKEAAKKVGLAVASKAIEKGIEKVVFDRGGYIYHGRVKELAEGAREGGLKF